MSLFYHPLFQKKILKIFVNQWIRKPTDNAQWYLAPIFSTIFTLRCHFSHQHGVFVLFPVSVTHTLTEATLRRRACVSVQLSYSPPWGTEGTDYMQLGFNSLSRFFRRQHIPVEPWQPWNAVCRHSLRKISQVTVTSWWQLKPSSTHWYRGFYSSQVGKKKWLTQSPPLAKRFVLDTHHRNYWDQRLETRCGLKKQTRVEWMVCLERWVLTLLIRARSQRSY